jgi:hypothetical protein
MQTDKSATHLFLRPSHQLANVLMGRRCTCVGPEASEAPAVSFKDASGVVRSPPRRRESHRHSSRERFDSPNGWLAPQSAARRPMHPAGRAVSQLSFCVFRSDVTGARHRRHPSIRSPQRRSIPERRSPAAWMLAGDREALARRHHGRFSIRNLMAVIVVSAIVLAALWLSGIGILHGRDIWAVGHPATQRVALRFHPGTDDSPVTATEPASSSPATRLLLKRVPRIVTWPVWQLPQAGRGMIHSCSAGTALPARLVAARRGGPVALSGKPCRLSSAQLRCGAIPPPS